jgi:hypothetical protein
VNPFSTRGWLRTGVAMATALALTATTVGVMPRPAEAASQSSPENGLVGPGNPSAGRSATEVAITPGSGWQEFSFITVGVAARGCSPADPGAPICIAGTNSQFVGTPPWTFTGPATLTVTDAFTSGDVFQIFDSGVLVGTTSAASAGQNCGNNPDTCQSAAGISRGTFSLGAGSHSITIVLQSLAAGSFGGVGFFRVDTGSVNPTCSLTQTVTRSGSTITLSYNASSTVATTFSLYLFVGASVSTVAQVSLPALTTPINTSFNVPNFPASGNVGWLATFSTPTGGIICSDFDVIQTS